MKKVITTFVLAAAFAAPVSAGQIFGSLKEDGRPLNGVKFEVFCRDRTYSGVTDGDGGYSIEVGRGRCTFRLYYREQTPNYDLYSYDNPLRYNFDVIKLSTGQYILRRR
jgi:hypothetical protein